MVQNREQKSAWRERFGAEAHDEVEERVGVLGEAAEMANRAAASGSRGWGRKVGDGTSVPFRSRGSVRRT